MKAGDEVMVPANTYIATILAISENGLTPILVEPDDVTCNLGARDLAAHLTPRRRQRTHLGDAAGTGSTSSGSLVRLANRAR